MKAIKSGTFELTYVLKCLKCKLKINILALKLKLKNFKWKTSKFYCILSFFKDID